MSTYDALKRAEIQEFQKDLSLIVKLNAKLHYDNKKELKMTYDVLRQKDAFKTAIGKKFLKRMEQMINGTDISHRCVLCNDELDNKSVICTHCIDNYKKEGSRENASVKPERNGDAQQVVPDVPKQAAASVKDGLDKFTAKINEMAGESGSVDLRLRDLFSNVLKKHTREEGEEIFIAGTLKTTPQESEIAASWPKPWLFSRVLLALLATFGLLYICAVEFGNSNAIPGLIFLGALAVPFSVLIFIFETNAPRNISIFETVKMFFYGGAASLVLTLILYEIFPPGELNYVGAMVVGFVEEAGKVLAVAIFVKKLNPRYILNGLLIGAAIGAGFAVFETMGYIFNIGLLPYLISNKIDVFIYVLVSRAWQSIGGHVAWTAIAGAGLVMAKGEEPLTSSSFTNPRFLTFFIIPVALHAIWNCPLRIAVSDINVKILALIAVAWIIILVLLNAGLKQIERKNGGKSAKMPTSKV